MPSALGCRCCARRRRWVRGQISDVKIGDQPIFDFRCRRCQTAWKHLQERAADFHRRKEIGDLTDTEMQWVVRGIV